MLVWASINGRVIVDKITNAQTDYPVINLKEKEGEETCATQMAQELATD